MGVWSNQVVPRFVDLVLGSDEVSKLRRRCLDGLAGDIVEPGFGGGLNLAHYPDQVRRVFAIDPSEVGKKLAQPRIADSSIAVEHVGLDGARLSLADDSCDGAALTFTLCTIPDHHAALLELRRVLKPGAPLHFLEHGLADVSRVQRWQRRLTPIQRRLGDGCHLDRPIVADIEAAGFTLEQVDERFMGRPRVASWFSMGVARNSDVPPA